GCARLAVQITNEELAIDLTGPGRRHLMRLLPVAVALEPGLALRRLTMSGYLRGLARRVECVRWPKRLPLRRAIYLDGEIAAPDAAVAESAAWPVSPEGAALEFLRELGIRAEPAAGTTARAEPIEDVSGANLSEYQIVAVVAADAEGRIQPSAATVIQAACVMADEAGAGKSDSATVLLIVPDDESLQCYALSQLRVFWPGDVILLSAGGGTAILGSLLK